MKKRKEQEISRKITLNRIAIVTLSKAESNHIVGRHLLNPQVGPSSRPACDPVSNTTLVTNGCEVQ
ncbi:hypothetical protein [Chitinophaga nivalis]|uniref:Uncharacterized protein n=1 Tax=Chitinophaga nivalis TaxID=2991709 RepID=A0ABT3IGU7_9BACT|nr:hypothetical protein [Chitinophaga nivalis]MCW3467129.1 hypothetical protein [Chitinophaga nivalis]MCW3483180.1 hypothetical protein [Chitinophaga nivalis]